MIIKKALNCRKKYLGLRKIVIYDYFKNIKITFIL